MGGAVDPGAVAAGVDCVRTVDAAAAADPVDTNAGAGIDRSADLEACAVTVALLVAAAATVGRVRLAMKTSTHPTSASAQRHR